MSRLLRHAGTGLPETAQEVIQRGLWFLPGDPQGDLPGHQAVAHTQSSLDPPSHPSTGPCLSIKKTNHS